MPQFIPVGSLYEEVEWAKDAVSNCLRVHHSATLCNLCIQRRDHLSDPDNYIEMDTDLIAISINIAKSEGLVKEKTSGHPH